MMHDYIQDRCLNTSLPDVEYIEVPRSTAGAPFSRRGAGGCALTSLLSLHFSESLGSEFSINYCSIGFENHLFGVFAFPGCFAMILSGFIFTSSSVHGYTLVYI